MNARKRMAALVMAASLMAGGLTGHALSSAPEVEAVSRVAINKYIRAHGGIPPCTHEDGSGQPGPCYWDASKRGNGKGHDFIAVPTKPGQDKLYVYLTGPKAKRY
jgi:hypothetical protein